MNEIITKREGGIVTATLNRPGQLNALNKGIFDELKFLMDVLETDRGTRALILTGSGEKAFCVGADLKERQTMNEKDVLSRMDFVHKLYIRMERAPFPILAAINGVALGGGLELALVCDFRIAAENAQVGFPEVDLGIIPGNGGTQNLSRIVGIATALELVLLAKKLTAAEALQKRIVNVVVPVGASLSTAKQWANKMNDSGPIAIRQAKLAIRLGFEKTLEQAMAIESECYKPCLYSKDRLEGLKAFQEKRKPEYQGV